MRSESSSAPRRAGQSCGRAAFVLGRVDSRVTARGFRNGARSWPGHLFIVTALIVAIVFNGRETIFANPRPQRRPGPGRLRRAGVRARLPVAGSLVMAIGLIFNAKPAWSTVGAWAAVPVIVVSLGFGYVSYRSVAAENSGNSTANGSMSITVNGVQAEPITANGVATCSTAQDSTRTVVAGSVGEPRIVSSDGRLTSAAITLSPDGTSAQINMTMTGLPGLSQTVTAAPGSTPSGGQLAVASGGWSGTVSWSCNQ